MIGIIALLGVSACGVGSNGQIGSLTGAVTRVWEDGFEFNTGDRSVTVDAWDVCGDNTQQNLAVGDELTLEGEFSNLEFDASVITNAQGEQVCP
ncbi:MAG: hypothetical protein HC922_11570 [Leptolyngbyaceae cyanobacterium SM2_3_12]|nr:hypothetical protein [Leptolyngbyaceae cyanobacterium SM2_3_12]